MALVAAIARGGARALPRRRCAASRRRRSASPPSLVGPRARLPARGGLPDPPPLPERGAQPLAERARARARPLPRRAGRAALGQLCGAAVALLVVAAPAAAEGRVQPRRSSRSASCLALLVFHGADRLGGDASGPPAGPRALAARGAFALTGVVLVSVAIVLAAARATRARAAGSPASRSPRRLASASVALAAIELARGRRRARSCSSCSRRRSARSPSAPTRAERRRHEHVDFLYRSMRAMQDAPEFRTALRELLGAARTMLCRRVRRDRAFEAAEPRATCCAARSARTASWSSRRCSATRTDAPWTRVAAHDGALLLPRGRAAARARRLPRRARARRRDRDRRCRRDDRRARAARSSATAPAT